MKRHIKFALVTTAALILAACGGSGSGSSGSGRTTSVVKPSNPVNTQPAAPTNSARTSLATQAQNTPNVAPSTASKAVDELAHFNLRADTAEQAQAKLNQFSQLSFQALAHADAVSQSRPDTPVTNLLDSDFFTSEINAKTGTSAKDNFGDGGLGLRILQSKLKTKVASRGLPSDDSHDSASDTSEGNSGDTGDSGYPDGSDTSNDQDRGSASSGGSESSGDTGSHDSGSHDSSSSPSDGGDSHDSIVSDGNYQDSDSGSYDSGDSSGELNYKKMNRLDQPSVLPSNSFTANKVSLTTFQGLFATGKGVSVKFVGPEITRLSQAQLSEFGHNQIHFYDLAPAGTDTQSIDFLRAAAKNPVGLLPGKSSFDSGLAYEATYYGSNGNFGYGLDFRASGMEVLAVRMNNPEFSGNELFEAVKSFSDPVFASKSQSQAGKVAWALDNLDYYKRDTLILIELPPADFSKGDTLVKANELFGLIAASQYADRVLFVTSDDQQYGKLLKGCGVTSNICVNVKAPVNANSALGSVAAIAALVKQNYPWMTPKQIRDVILTTTNRDGKFNSVTGWQSPNAESAVLGPRAILGDTTWNLSESDYFGYVDEQASIPASGNGYAFVNSIGGTGTLTLRGKYNFYSPLYFYGDLLPSNGVVLESGYAEFGHSKTVGTNYSSYNPQQKALAFQPLFDPSNYNKVISKAYKVEFGTNGKNYFTKYTPVLNKHLQKVPSLELFDNHINRLTVISRAAAVIKSGYFENLNVNYQAKVYISNPTEQPIAFDSLTIGTKAELHLLNHGYIPDSYHSNDDGVGALVQLESYEKVKNDPALLSGWLLKSAFIINANRAVFVPETALRSSDLDPMKFAETNASAIPKDSEIERLRAEAKSTAPEVYDALLSGSTSLYKTLSSQGFKVRNGEIDNYLKLLKYIAKDLHIKNFYEAHKANQVHPILGYEKLVQLRQKIERTSSIQNLTAADLLTWHDETGRSFVVKELDAQGYLYVDMATNPYNYGDNYYLFGYGHRTNKEFSAVFVHGLKHGVRFVFDDDQGIAYLGFDSSASDWATSRSLVLRGVDALNEGTPTGYSRVYTSKQLDRQLVNLKSDEQLLTSSSLLASNLLSYDQEPDPTQLELAQAPSNLGTTVVLSDKLTKEDNPVRALAGTDKPTGVTVKTTENGVVKSSDFSLNDKDVYLQARKALADYSDLELGTFLYRASAAAYSASHLAVSQQTRVLNSDFLVQAGQFKQPTTAADLANAASGAAASSLKLNTYAQYAFKRADWIQEASQVVGKWNHHNFAVGVYGQLDLNQAVNTAGSTAGTAGNLGAVNLGLAATHLTGTWLEALDAKFDKSVLSENQVSSTSLVATAGYAWNKAFLNLGAAYSYQGFNSQRTLFTERDLTAEYARHEAALSALAGAQLVGDQLVGLQARAGVTATYSYQGEFGEKLNSEPKATDAAKALALTAKSASAWELVGNLGVVGTYKFVSNGLTQGLDASVDVSLRALNADYAVKGETLVNKAAKTEFTSGATFKPTYLVRAQAGYSYEFVPGLNVRVGAGYSKTTNWGAFEGDVKLTYSF